MKLVIAALATLSLNAFAIDMGAAKDAAGKAMDKSKEIFAACKSEKVQYCDSYTQLEPLKECLGKNKEKLSPGCKKTAGL